MSAIIEYKCDINYIQTLPAQIQQKVLQKIFAKIFNTKICTQRKTLNTLKTDVFELPDNKNIGKLLSKYELFSLDQDNFISDPSQILILQYLFPTGSPSLTICVKFPPCQLEPLFNVVLIMFSIDLPIFSYPIRPHATVVVYIKLYAKPSQSNLLSNYIQIIIPYWLNTLPIKKLSL